MTLNTADPWSFCACNEREICWNLLDSVTSCVTGVGHMSLKAVVAGPFILRLIRIRCGGQILCIFVPGC